MENKDIRTAMWLTFTVIAATLFMSCQSTPPSQDCEDQVFVPDTKYVVVLPDTFKCDTISTFNPFTLDGQRYMNADVTIMLTDSTIHIIHSDTTVIFKGFWNNNQFISDKDLKIGKNRQCLFINNKLHRRTYRLRTY